MLPTAQLPLLLSLVLLAACGAKSEPEPSTTQAKPGKECDLRYHKEACYESSRVVCKGVTAVTQPKGIWQLEQTCQAGEVCVEAEESGNPPYWLAQCKPAPLADVLTGDAQDDAETTQLSCGPQQCQIASPVGAGTHDPLTDPAATVMTVTATGPGTDVTLDKVTLASVAAASAGASCNPGLACAGVPVGGQLTVEVWSKAPKQGQTNPPVLGRGRTLPFYPGDGLTPATAWPYVTRPNHFAPVVTATGAAVNQTARAGQTLAELPDPSGRVVVIGGGKLAQGATDPMKASSWQGMLDEVAVYDPNTRLLVPATSATGPSKLSVPRTLHTSATGTNYIAVVGGYAGGPNGPILTDTVEYIDKNLTVTTGEGGNPKLVFARAGASVIRMFEDEDFFLVLGGKGNTPCKDDKGNRLDCAGNIWELIHPKHGTLQQGRLAVARWNHATVRMPGPSGGYAVLIGGEDDNGVLGSFELVQFSKEGSGKISSLDAECPDATGSNCDFFYKPLVQGMPQAGTMMGAAYVESPDHQLIYMVGGFTDLAHKKPSDRLHVFDLHSGDYVDQGFALGTARGRPILATTTAADGSIQVLVAGGIGDAGSPVASAESILVQTTTSPSGGSQHNIQVIPAANALLNGARDLAAAIALRTSHILVTGGVSGENPAQLVPLQVWNPL
jgi:hypothetical protein